MDTIEKAIRDALEKGDAADDAFRVRVYRSIISAFDRTLAGGQRLSPEVAAARRQELMAKIAAIESEFVPATVPVTQPAEPAPPRSGDVGGLRSDPVMRRDDGYPTSPPAAPDLQPEPRIEPEDYADSGGYPDFVAEPNDGVPGYRESGLSRRRRRPFAFVFVIATLVAAVAIGVWWLFQTGALLSDQQRDTAAYGTPQPLAPDSFDPDAAPSKASTPEVARDAIVIFAPSDPTSATASPGVKAGVVGGVAESGAFLRVQSLNPGGTISFDVGQGILRQVAGKRAVFDIVAQGDGEKETQISVSCNFGALGDCDRKRYRIGISRDDFLFDVKLPDASPDGDGTIVVNPDLDGRGRAVDIFSISVSVAK